MLRCLLVNIKPSVHLSARSKRSIKYRSRDLKCFVRLMSTSNGKSACIYKKTINFHVCLHFQEIWLVNKFLFVYEERGSRLAFYSRTNKICSPRSEIFRNTFTLSMRRWEIAWALRARAQVDTGLKKLTVDLHNFASAFVRRKHAQKHSSGCWNATNCFRTLFWYDPLINNDHWFLISNQVYYRRLCLTIAKYYNHW